MGKETINPKTGTTKPSRGKTKSMMKSSSPFKKMTNLKTSYSKKTSR